MELQGFTACGHGCRLEVAAARDHRLPAPGDLEGAKKCAIE